MEGPDLPPNEKVWGNDEELVMRQLYRIKAEQPAWTGVLTDPIRRQIQEGVHPGLFAGSFAGWEQFMQRVAREFRRREKLPEPEQISLKAKIQVIRDAGLEVPEFPSRVVPQGLDVGDDVPRAQNGQPAPPSLIGHWTTRVDAVYRKAQALPPKKTEEGGQAPSA